MLKNTQETAVNTVEVTLLIEREKFDKAVNEAYKKEVKKILKNNMFAHQLIKPYDDLDESDQQLDKNIIQKLPDILRMLN